MLISPEICSKYTDQELVERSLTNLDYFSCIYERYEKKLLNYIRRLTAVSEEEAEDILQESFIKVWKNLNNIDLNARLSSWLYRLVHNEVITYWRKNKHRQPALELSEHLLHSISEDLEISRISEEELNREIQTIAEKHRQVIILKYFENMSYEEISDILKIPEGTVAIRLSRAKKELKSRLQIIDRNS